MRFKVGDYFPDFIFNTAYRKNLQVHEILNKETVFWCIRYIGCPVCRYDVHCIKEKYAEIQKKNAQVFVVMQSDQKHIQDVIKEGDSLTVNMGESLEFDGKTYPIHPLPDNLMDIINAGGLVKAMQKRNGII